MDSKRKMIIAICAFAMVLLATVVAVVAVLAAQQVTVNSNIKISYTASGLIAGKIKTEYSTDNFTSSTTIKTTDENEYITFDGSEGDGTSKALKETNSLSFTKTTTEYIFKFTFTSISSTLGYDATLVYSDTGTTDNNVTITYSADNSTYNATAATVTVPQNNVAKYYYVKVVLNDVANDAEFSGSFSWTLNNPRAIS